MSQEGEERIHPASPARQQAAHREGDFAKSQQVSAAIQIIGGLLVAVLLLEPLFQWLSWLSVDVWSQPWTANGDNPAVGRGQEPIRRLQQIILGLLVACGPILGLMFGIGVLSHWCQTGPVFLPNKIGLDWNRINPFHWFSQTFSLSGWSQPLIYLPKIFLALAVMGISAWNQRNRFQEIALLPADEIGSATCYLVLSICGNVAGTLLVAALLDYWIKHLAFQKRIQMSDQQLRDEAKMQNGASHLWKRKRMESSLDHPKRQPD